MNSFKLNSIIVTKLDHIGDMVLTTPVFRAIKERYPDCSLGVLCSSKGKMVLRNNPYIDDLYVYDPDMCDRGKENNAYTKLLDFQSVLKARDKKYDVCISLREDYNNALIQKMLGAQYNLSFHTESPYPELLYYSIDNPGSMHTAAKNFELLKFVDIAARPKLKTEIFITEDDRKWVRAFLEKYHITQEHVLIGVSPGGGWFLNWWPWKNYARICEMLSEYDSRIRIILVGGHAEKEVIANIKNDCKYELIDSGGQTTIQQLAGLYQCMKLVICNDGGPMHVASTASVPIIALFGPSPQWFYPVGEGNVVIHKKFACSPCPQFQPGERPKCLNNKCMKSIRVQEVYRKAVNILSRYLRNKDAEVYK